MIKIKSEILKSAILYKAKNDVRYYLKGLYIDYNTIVATNGHICFRAPIESDEQRIIKFQGKLPTKFKECLITDNQAKFTDEKDNVISIIGVETVDARYPIYERLYNDRVNAISEIGMRGDYLQLLGKTAKLLTTHQGCKFIFESSSSGIKVLIGIAEIVLMPTSV